MAYVLRNATLLSCASFSWSWSIKSFFLTGVALKCTPEKEVVVLSTATSGQFRPTKDPSTPGSLNKLPFSDPSYSEPHWGPVLAAGHGGSHLILQKNLEIGYHYFTYCTDGETEANRFIDFPKAT